MINVFIWTFIPFFVSILIVRELHLFFILFCYFTHGFYYRISFPTRSRLSLPHEARVKTWRHFVFILQDHHPSVSYFRKSDGGEVVKWPTCCIFHLFLKSETNLYNHWRETEVFQLDFLIGVLFIRIFTFVFDEILDFFFREILPHLQQIVGFRIWWCLAKLAKCIVFLMLYVLPSLE